jgi:multisubunit Na+/H+ antiporter MnhF subunit
MLLIILLFTLYLAINKPLAFYRLLHLSTAVINTLIAIAIKLYSLYTASTKERR